MAKVARFRMVLFGALLSLVTLLLDVGHDARHTLQSGISVPPIRRQFLIEHVRAMVNRSIEECRKDSDLELLKIPILSRITAHSPHYGRAHFRHLSVPHELIEVDWRTKGNQRRIHAARLLRKRVVGVRRELYVTAAVEAKP